jgi:hypothetical protein
LVLSGIAMAQTPGTFTATGNMTAERSWHTATLLADGRVLIAGGFDASSTLASAELYDPLIGTFKTTGKMTMPRSEHSATLLPNGKVLIAGGMVYGGNHANPLRSAELYDPETGTFSVTGDMTAGHAYNHATLLRNGQVLIAGGTSEVTAEIYDPVKRSFSTRPGGTEPGEMYVKTSTLFLSCRKYRLVRERWERSGHVDPVSADARQLAENNGSLALSVQNSLFGPAWPLMMRYGTAKGNTLDQAYRLPANPRLRPKQLRQLQKQTVSRRPKTAG